MFDIGGTVIFEEDIYRALLEKEKLVLNEEKYITADKFEDAVRMSILSSDSNIIRGVAWRFTAPDKELCEKVIRKTRSFTDELLQMYPRKLISGIDKVLENLNGKYILSLAGNTNGDIRYVLEKLDVLKFFSYTEVSDDIKISKPDIRFYQYYLDMLGVNAEDTIMIGDRLDNDIIPAKSLGIKTILFKNGLYSILEPRKQNEMPDYTVESSLDILIAIKYLSNKQ